MSEKEKAPRPKRILVVDDDRIIQRNISVKLKDKGYQVVTALEASQALSALRQNKPDLILLDINFPPDVAHGGGVGWDGIGILEWFQRVDAAKSIPVIIISGTDPAKCEDRVKAIGAVAFFQKPIDHAELHAAIQKHLG